MSPENSAPACPVCHHSLSPFLFNGVEVDICSAGRCGVWFDYGEAVVVQASDSLDAIDQAFAGEFQPQPVQEELEKPTKRCPRDGEELSRYEWNLGSGIVLDRCPHDGGIWMDAGELEAYAALVKEFQAHPPVLTPELQAKLDADKAKIDASFGEALDRVTGSHVRWDAWLLDDMLRGMMKGLISPFSTPRR
jgi:Zn-finger nucleic acid-binding protein